MTSVMLRNETCVEKEAARLLDAGTPPDDTESTNLVWLGILIGLTASVLINYGQNTEFVNPDDEAESDEVRAKLRRRRNRGKAMFGIGVVLNFVAFAFAPPSILAPLEGAQFVAHFVFNYTQKNPTIVRDGRLSPNGRRTAVGTLLVLFGVALPVIPALIEPKPVPRLSDDVIWCLWSSIDWWITVGVGIGIALLALAVASSIGAPFYKFGYKPTAPPSTDRMGQVLYVVPAVVVGAFAVVNAKAISELVELILGGEWKLLGEGLFWMTAVFVAVGFLAWLEFLRVGPKIFDPLAMIPLLQGGYILASSIAGAIFFEDFSTFDTTDSLFFAGGLCLLLVGLFLIVPVADATDQTMSGWTITDVVLVRIGAGFTPILFVPRISEYRPVLDGGSEDRVPILLMKS